MGNRVLLFVALLHWAGIWGIRLPIERALMMLFISGLRFPYGDDNLAPEL